MARSRLDPNQIAQHVFDEESEANKVKMVNTEIAMELSAEDGDSVVAESHVLNEKVLVNQEVDVEKCSNLKLFIKSLEDGVSTVKLQISPLSEGDFWIDLSTSLSVGNSGSVSASSTFDKVLAKRARVVQSVSQQVDLYLLGRNF